MQRLLWSAVEDGNHGTLMALLNEEQCRSNMQAVINHYNSDGWAPIHVAASEGYAGIIDILLRHGAVADARTKNFRTALHIACVRGQLQVISALLKAGADVDGKELNGNTPSHFCAEYGHRDCLRLLLAKHPTLFSKNNEGKTCIDIATNHDILLTFEEYIKNVKSMLNINAE